MTSLRKDLLLDVEYCYYCGRKTVKTKGKPHTKTIDHKTPKARGGTNHPSNLVVACWRCNHIKDNLTEAEFLARHGSFCDLPEIYPQRPVPRARRGAKRPKLSFDEAPWMPWIQKMDRQEAKVPAKGTAKASLKEFGLSRLPFSRALEHRILIAEYRLSFSELSFSQWKKQRGRK